MFSKLGGTTIFSTIDLRSGYYHIGLTRESRAKSAFVVPMGKWQFKCTPFGLSQAPAYFQLLIDKVLMGCSSFAMGYLDDIIIFSKTEEEHLQHLEEIFVRLRKFGLKMKHEKCSFFKKHIQYLGHLVSEKGFELLLEKLESIRKMPAPRTTKEVKEFLNPTVAPEVCLPPVETGDKDKFETSPVEPPSITINTSNPVQTKPRHRQRVCGTFATKSFILRKIKRKRNYRCKLCEVVLSSAHLLTVHHQGKHGILYCETCNKAFNNPTSLVRHKYQHREL